MYKHLTKAKFIVIIIVFLLSIPASLSSTVRATSAENGEWIAIPFVYPTTGSVYAVVGEDIIGCAKQVSESTLFFDINKSAWTELRFDAQQAIRKIDAKGHTVFAYTDEFLVGYSSFTGNYDVIQYDGVLLSPTGYNPSYGCGRNLAFFVTNETMYAFDSELGRWQEYDYGLPVDYSGSNYIIRDDYVWTVLKRGTYGEKQPKNVVYSLHTHSFNQLESGCGWPGERWLDHGFAGFYTHAVENYTLVGYSAFTNEFSLVQVMGQGYVADSTSVSDLTVGEITTFAISFVHNLEPSGERGYFYGYDTRLGSWSSTTLDFASGERWSKYWMPGGQFAVDMAILPGEVYKFILYSGITGQFSITTPGLTYDSVTSFILCGGEVLVVYDVDDAWGQSFTTGQSSMISLDKPYTAFYPSGKDFCAFYRYSDQSNTMTMYFYNSKTNNWTTIDLTKSITSYGNTEHVFVSSSYESPIRETVFYSSLLDSYVKCEFPVNSSVSVEAKYNLAWARSSNRSYLFDTQRGIIYPFDFMFTTNGLGDFATSFHNAETKTLYGYSVLSGKWTNLTISDTPYTCEAKGFIGLISSNTGSNYYSKYYAFNGFEDSWVELVPSGTYKGHKIGEKTALVIRSDMLYAFDPNGRIGTYNYLIEFEGGFFPVSISANSTISNFSFNQSIREISFNVTGQDGTVGFCNLTFPSTLVQNLWQGTFTVLVDGKQPMHISTLTDGTYTYVYFTYVHSEHEVVIIPEFSSLVILPLFMGVTLLTIMLRRRKHSRPNASKS
ncbi:hypothetical protein G4O51_12795 [Candidatus Bathyarchaeota archaeon A05DMB-2]|jgi:hypothetical protein|nr:hypothetical protein [Candidatus Bathyarchaeota archaeon A05DMB-2]MDH7564782.1 hypothetical protein [Candidatus Bathyarchaeota archaeon]